MIGSANASSEASERGSGNACKNLPGGEVERGECVAPATQTRTVTCKEVFGQTPTPSAEETCTAVTTVGTPALRNTAQDACKAAGDPEPDTKPVTGGPGFTITCGYPATITTTSTCPNDIVPTPGPNPQCITKPGNRT
jgi:hypothetical protein